MQTKVLVRDGYTLAVGGLIQENTSVGTSQVPVLGDIPIIGWLFKQKEDFETGRELVVFVTPTILRNPDGSLPLPPTGR